MGTPHKHAAVIKAWADGAVIQFKSRHTGDWKDTPDNAPMFWTNTEYRVKPEPKKVRVKLVKPKTPNATIHSVCVATEQQRETIDINFRDWITVKDWFEVEYTEE